MLFFSFALRAFGDCPTRQLFSDLEIVKKIDDEIKDHLPLVINYQTQGGYFTMPSARTFDAGLFGLGFSYVPPYHIWSQAFQFFNHLETVGNYWVFNGVMDPVFGHMGFGDSADRAANIKLIFLRKEDGFPFMPDFAIGWNDFLGSQRFRSFYAVATQEFLTYDLEATLGWGTGRMKGFYGGLAWTPFRKYNTFLQALTLVAEYDANDYKRHVHEHPGGRKVDSRINVGAQYTLWNLFRFSGSTLRGNQLAGSLALSYDLGNTRGFIPKIYDPAPYSFPTDTQPIGPIRSRQELACDLAYAFQEQGFDLYRLYLIPEEGGKDQLWLKVVNLRYREEEKVRERIEYVLAHLAPSNIARITVVTESDGIPVQEYRFRLEDLRRFASGRLGADEFLVIAPPEEVSKTPNDYDAAQLYQRKKPMWVFTFRPWFQSYLGSSRGKFKYEVGFLLNQEGYLLDQIYYNITGAYTAKSSTVHLMSQDILNPSRIINVRTDSILYSQSNSIHLTQAFLQKSWNLGLGWFSRLAFGYFEQAYAGAALETLYYPVRTNWAVGFEIATLLKRSYYGIGFERKARQYTDDGFVFFPYTGLQYFVNFHYQLKPLNLDFNIKVGQFLARDKGIRVEGGRTFASGLRVGLWYTLTNAADHVNGDRYYDKGFSISVPFDLFLNKSSRTRIGYAMSAWLRDCGAISATGRTLYPTLFWDRYNDRPTFY
ncbi:MAG: hypothetical protein A3D96_05885 [Chlamydiae bacterium RIFCSPHIGHO2_12_FULL_44_59]|nr:MAG: hypothetical protein A2796_03710 [Chlamydiae bacterium RIFCSPHIGHO2_01_FULL_44_39]OGN57531.1 MAG: hypothetical protein A3C42_02020 [Chlamydiae bacterium RIFCSPHIGHO2_02_FULL_45_9]OGN61216.1 MAG: hypothetical protein A3D96_05885 [Chlamydiae bacterium RIFCSPHIGHO2_12_FULL_44_59]OGN65687.1 MAG: hypothetical protein A2978_06690 [Chlamydiae bacterium RIFCSPLOWO2_01_FULL_44_52]OGN68164.1 MAG: hypothetical protein A3I67_05360 [Chlamydiae bacterium RIFCSPLOWO2_02_FULL_45_22]OGN69050.1 MAG: hyp